MPSPVPRSSRRGALALFAALSAGLLSGCTADAAPSPEPPSPSASASETAAPVLLPDGTATENLPLFAAVMDDVWNSDARVQGRAYIDALTAAGFDKAAMEVTPDRTSVDDPVDSLQFSVLWKGQCLVGQVGPSTPQPTALVLDPVPSGTCLIGHTRTIDW